MNLSENTLKVFNIRCIATILISVMLFWLVVFYQAAASGMPTEEPYNSRMLLSPLPHHIEIDKAVTVDGDKLVLLMPESASQPLSEGVKDLSVKIGQLCGHKPLTVNAVKDIPANAQCVLRFSENKINNPDLAAGARKAQGYQIVPASKGEKPGLYIAGADPAGAFYATQTLLQLLNVNDKRKLILPLVNVIDCPDLEDRGYFLDVRRESISWDLKQWKQHIDWASSLRFNVILVQIVTSAGGKLLNYQSKEFPELINDNTPLSKHGLFRKIIEYGRSRAVRIVPTIPHPTCFEQLWKDHPDAMMSIKGRKTWGGAVIEDDRQAVDFGKPETVEIIRRIFADLIEQTQPDELSVWPTEAPWYTAEESILQVNVLHDVFLDAVGKNSDKVVLRMLTTPISLHNPQKMFKLLPATVKIDYYGSMETYTLKGIQFRDPAIEIMREKGFHFSTMPMYGRLFWQSAPIIFPKLCKENAVVSARKGAQGLVANGGDQPTAFMVNYATSAEYSWNLDGRDVSQFIEVLAAKQEWPKPESVADFYLHLEQACIPITLVTQSEGFLPEKLSALQQRLEKVSPENLRSNYIEPLQKAVTEAQRALSIAKIIDYERFKIEVEVILAMSRALLSLHQGFYHYGKDASKARGFFEEAKEHFRDLERVWPELERINPGTVKNGPMPGYRRDLPEFLKSDSRL